MKKVFLSVLISLFSFYINAQSRVGTSFQNLVSVSTLPPEAASLGKFGNIPVSYCTGIPSITIPIHEIVVGKIKLPISLDYHAGGIKVDELASSVGLGWALNGPGVISRQMVGAPDESGGGASFFRSPDPDSVWLSPQNYYTFLYGVRNDTEDAEPDVFQYSINGQSGKFTFRRDKTIMQTPVTNNKVVYTSAATFTITDEQGILYIFDKAMRTTLSGESGIGSYISSWRLTKMVDVNSIDTVYFSYEESCNASSELMKSYTHFLGPKSTCSDGGASWVFTSEPNVNYQTIGHYEAYPKEISSRGGKLIFTNICDRIDVTGSALRLSGVDVYSDQDGVLKKVKRISLHHGYFYSTGSGNAFYDVSEEKKRRLRLDSVRALPITGTDAPQVYRMTYDTTSIMAPRESAAQDLWGLNNGEFDNSTLMPEQTHYYGGSYYTFGSAKRGSNEGYMKACTIQSIEYPTKGKTVFEFEGHKYRTYQSETTTGYVSCNAYGSVQQSNTTTFTAGSNASGFRYSIFISKFNYPDVTDRPRVTLTDLTTGQQIFFITTVPATATDQDFNTGVQALSLTSGHTYQLNTNIYTNNPSVRATAEISWTEVLPDIEVIKPGGGLRVKSITNYDIDGIMAGRELYDYPDGTILTGQYYQNLNYEEIISRGASLSSCAYYYPGGGFPAYSVVYHANSVLPSSQCGGSPILYSSVTKYQVDANGKPNGKTVYGYNVVQDQTALAILPAITPLHTFNTIGIYLASNSWKNGFLSIEQVYKYKDGVYTMIKSLYNDYRPYRETSMNILKIKNICINACCTFANQYPGYVSQDFSLTSVPQQTGAMLLRSSTDTTWDENNNKLLTIENYYYDDATHSYPTRKETINSEGDTLTEEIKYPHDLAVSGNVYQKMYDRNIVSPTVQHISKKNGVQLSLAKINYNDWYNNSQLLLPQTVEEQISSNPTETRIRFNSYDIYGNILEQQKNNDQPLNYLWGYDTLYPIATATNAVRSDIAYTSFEADISGNWIIASAVRDTTQGITGSRSYLLSNGAISKAGLNTAKSFIVSYWSKSGSATVNGSTALALVNRNGWNYYEHKLSAGVSNVTVSGSVIIDELRLYPSDAQMNTFTYDPLVGMTSQCSANNLITYYEFDALGRLQVIRDMDKKILKVFEYYYKQ